MRFYTVIGSYKVPIGRINSSIEHMGLTPIQLDPSIGPTKPKHLIQIQDAKYEKADLRAITENCTNLSDPEKHSLLDLLQEFEELFNEH